MRFLRMYSLYANVDQDQWPNQHVVNSINCCAKEACALIVLDIAGFQCHAIQNRSK